MEYRRELSEKSKKLIAMQFKSDILNVSTGYYKKENIFPITPKPNESRQKMKEFTPKYKEIKPHEMRFNNLLSDQQKRNKALMNNLKILKTKRNPEVEIKRSREQSIKDNCYDKRGNFSAKKRYFLEFYGLGNMNKTSNNIYKRSASKSIRDTRNENKSFLLKRIQKSLDLTNYDKESNTDIYSIINNKENYNEDTDDYENSFLNDNNKNNDVFKNNIINKKNNNKISRNRNNKIYRSLSSISNEEYTNTFNYKINKNKIYNKIKTDIFYTDRDIHKNKEKEIIKNDDKKNQKKYNHPKDLSKIFYTETNNPVKCNRLNKNEKINEEKEYFNLQIKYLNSLKNNPDPKKIKDIFYKNGLHIYDFNEDGMNILSREKKLEAKLRKNKKDEDFDRNYRKAIRELKKLNLDINKRKIINEKGFESKVIRKKRKGTPGKILIKNKQNKDENTKLNTGFGFKRDKNILPQKNQNYKNDYNYRLSYFNHKKK